MQLILGIEDIEAVVVDDLIANVDGPDDGGIDFVHVDTENRFIVVGQEYIANGKKAHTATAVPRLTKAKGLTSGLQVLLNKPIDEVPERLRSSANKVRSVIGSGAVDTIHIWLVHNLAGSKNMKDELRTAEIAARSASKDNIEVVSLEVSADEIERRYKSLSTPILVNKKFQIDIGEHMIVTAEHWEAITASVPLAWFYDQYKKYGTDLFSANVRDYLGIPKRVNQNINSNIQLTAEKDPANFWVFNNGMTALVHDFGVKNNRLNISGVSILNGAQTTGAISNLPKKPKDTALVQVRFVKCDSGDIINQIRRYNNSQNKIEAPDFRSSDSVQTRLQGEFSSTKINYLSRRGGIEDIVKRKPNTLPSVLAGQILAAFHGRPDIAYHEKTKIWEDDLMYGKYFNEHTQAKHIVLAYALFEAVKNKKALLVKQDKEDKLKDIERDQLTFFRTRGAVFLMISAVANCLETFLGNKIANKFRLEFKNNVSWPEAITIWGPLVEIASQLSSSLQSGFAAGAIREQQANEAIKQFSALIAAVGPSNKTIYNDFASKVIERVKK